MRLTLDYEQAQLLQELLEDHRRAMLRTLGDYYEQSSYGVFIEGLANAFASAGGIPEPKPKPKQGRKPK